MSLKNYAQIGGRFKEIRNQKKLAKHIKRGGWVIRPWVPNQLKTIEIERKLFTRYRTNNSKFKEKIQKNINLRRNRKRIRGNDVFYKKKYFR